MHRHGASLHRALFTRLFAAISCFGAPSWAFDPGSDAILGTHTPDASRNIGAVVVTIPEVAIYQGASTQSPRRGSAEQGAPLPVFGARAGEGCHGSWLAVGPEAFVCEDAVSESNDPAASLDAPQLLSPDGLPYRYYFVSKDGSFGYDALETAEQSVPSTQLQPGFGVALSRIARQSTGEAYGLTSHGFWVPLRDLAPASPVSFQGSAWSESLAWVIHEQAREFSAPGKPRRGATRERLTTLSVLEERKQGGTGYARVGPDVWLRSDDLRRPLRVSPPAEIRPLERWLDVDLARQTLVAYVGELPIFATLVSSGRGARGTETSTPVGSFRIWVKLRTSDMDNTDQAGARENYAIAAVPWVMYFEKGYGLHGAFWHRRFGEVKSHGCVNLAPLDAERLFHWTTPRLYPGWSAVLPSPHDPGTLVHVH
jgi:lipoprotein-anchoring transpeptidase ErfK/SrfK